MKFRSTLILIIIAVGIGGYIYFVEQHQQTTADAEKNNRQIASIDREQANVISIKNPEAKIELRKTDPRKWVIEAPLKDRADTMEVSQLFTTLEGLQYDDVIGNKGDAPTKEQLKEFGLDSSESSIKISGGKEPIELVLGKDAAVEGKSYAKLAGRDLVYVISNDLKTQISKSPDDFRDRKLADLSVTDVQKVVFKTPAGEIEAEKKDDHWSLVKPITARGDDSRIGDLISQATTARVDEFVKETTNSTTTGLDMPRGTVSLFTAAAEKPAILNIGNAATDGKTKGDIYVSLSTREATVLVPKAIESLIEIKPNDLRDRKVLRFEMDIVDRVTIEPAGKPKLVLARDKENWALKGETDQPVNGAVVSRILSELKAASVVDFASDVATDLEKYGLQEPQLKITLSSFASENTSETQAGEKVIETLLIGKTEGSNLYAKVDSEPYIVSMPATILDSLVTDPIQLQELAIFKDEPGDVISLELMNAGQPPLSLDRDEQKNWKLAKGDGKLDQTNIQSLVNTLSKLRAVRWVGPTEIGDGLDKPTLTVSYKAGGDKVRSLKVGSQTKDNMWTASADGLNGTFIVSNPDMEALQLPLLEKPAGEKPAEANPAAAPGTEIKEPKARIEAVTPPVSAPPLPTEPAPAPSEPAEPLPPPTAPEAAPMPEKVPAEKPNAPPAAEDALPTPAPPKDAELPAGKPDPAPPGEDAAPVPAPPADAEKPTEAPQPSPAAEEAPPTPAPAEEAAKPAPEPAPEESPTPPPSEDASGPAPESAGQ